jgi:hypothetical protein
MIEIIATILIMGILAAFFIHFMGTAIDHSSESMELVIGEAEAEGLMEEIIAYYTSEINRDLENALSTIKSKEENGDFGNSDNISTDWILFNSSGNEQIVTLGESNNLKVTVQIIDQGEERSNTLTTILTKSRNNSGDPIVYW